MSHVDVSRDAMTFFAATATQSQSGLIAMLRVRHGDRYRITEKRACELKEESKATLRRYHRIVTPVDSMLVVENDRMDLNDMGKRLTEELLA